MQARHMCELKKTAALHSRWGGRLKNEKKPVKKPARRLAIGRLMGGRGTNRLIQYISAVRI